MSADTRRALAALAERLGLEEALRLVGCAWPDPCACDLCEGATVHRCQGALCPGLTYPPSAEVPHPRTCLAVPAGWPGLAAVPRFVVGDPLRVDLPPGWHVGAGPGRWRIAAVGGRAAGPPWDRLRFSSRAAARAAAADLGLVEAVELVREEVADAPPSS